MTWTDAPGIFLSGEKEKNSMHGAEHHKLIKTGESFRCLFIFFCSTLLSNIFSSNIFVIRTKELKWAGGLFKCFHLDRELLIDLKITFLLLPRKKHQNCCSLAEDIWTSQFLS